MKRIAILTATRAEYGLLVPVIKKLREYEDHEFKVCLIVTGTHLKKEFGYTVNEIENDGIRIDYKVEIPVKNDDAIDISDNQAESLIKFTSLFAKEKFDAVMLLGDRYEIFAAAIAAGNTNTPVFHLCGGDTTEGAMDEWMRHSITKISYLHFVTNEISKRRVIQMGEDPERVFNYGSTGIDNAYRISDMKKNEVLESIGVEECRFALCTYHPVTLEGGSEEEQIDTFIDCIREFPDIMFIVTKANADLGGSRINSLLEKASEKTDNMMLFDSLGVRRYLSLMKYSEFVLGNSSSGILETPAFHIPTVNIGDRQRGRLQSKGIINCPPVKEDIVSAINKALSDDFRKSCLSASCEYGDGHAAEKIASKCIEVIKEDRIDLKKKFYDINSDGKNEG